MTEEEALENIKDAIRTYLETNVVLKPAGKSFERGWTEVINNKVFPLEQLFETEHEEYKVPPVDIIQI